MTSEYKLVIITQQFTSRNIALLTCENKAGSYMT